MLYDSGDNALVLVAGKPAVLKVNAVTTSSTAPKPTGTLRVENTVDGTSRDLLLTPPTAAIPAAVPAVPSFADSYSATIPADLVKAGLRLSARLDNGTVTTVTPRVGGGVSMRFMPIAVRIADTTGQLPKDQTAHIQALFPVSKVTQLSRPVYTSTRVTAVPTTEDGWSSAFSKILSELADLRTVEGAADRDYYFGYIPKRTWGLAGLGYMPGRAAVGFDMPSSPDSVRDVTAHELGHNFSLPHAACGGAGSPDPSYPYPDANLGKPGRYVWSYLADTNSFYDPRPTTRHDIMSYCGGVVFSDYNYRKMQVFVTPTDKLVLAKASGAGTAVSTEPREVLLISGELYEDGRVELNPVKSFVGRVSVPTGSSHTLRVKTASGSSVDFPFSPEVLDHAVKVKHFSLVIPNDGALQSLSVLQAGKALPQVGAASAAVVGTAARAAVQTVAEPASVRAQNGQVQLTWNASRYPYASLVWVGADGRRLVLAQDLRNGQALVPAADLPAGGRFELILSDGLNATRQQFAR
ncbi:hypothetical protein DBR42_02015 [Pelomonas sp. HMWF004]|nr:hypothetical protein DBR42_02015 [Pelomonas sp. HMWF004]